MGNTWVTGLRVENTAARGGNLTCTRCALMLGMNMPDETLQSAFWIGRFLLVIQQHISTVSPI